MRLSRMGTSGATSRGDETYVIAAYPPAIHSGGMVMESIRRSGSVAILIVATFFGTCSLASAQNWSGNGWVRTAQEAYASSEGAAGYNQSYSNPYAWAYVGGVNRAAHAEATYQQTWTS